MLELVKGGEGGGGGGHGGGGGGAAHFGAIGGGDGMGGGLVGGGLNMHSAPNMGNSFAHMGGGNGGRIARGGGFNAGMHAPLPTIGTATTAVTTNYNRSYAYGDYGSCGWLYRRAVATNNPYWWNRYYACAG